MFWFVSIGLMNHEITLSIQSCRGLLTDDTYDSALTKRTRTSLVVTDGWTRAENTLEGFCDRMMDKLNDRKVASKHR